MLNKLLNNDKCKIKRKPPAYVKILTYSFKSESCKF